MSTWYSDRGAILTEDGYIIKTEGYNNIIADGYGVTSWSEVTEITTPTWTAITAITTPTWDSAVASVGEWLCENIDINCEDIDTKCEDMG